MSQKAQSTRALILEKAEEMFVQKGYVGTSMEDIVQHSGMSKGSIYYHFGSKEKLFMALIETFSNGWIKKWGEAETQSSSFQEKLHLVTEYYVKDFHNPLLKVIDEFYMNTTAQQEFLDQSLHLVQAPLDVYKDIFQAGIDEGVVKENDAHELALVFTGLMNGLGVNYYQMEVSDLEQLYTRAVQLFLEGVLVL
ncbi:TetR family transcriptional regulator [Bacillaceae bacterium SIJ1]|uniref:TetR/AcrR family transcriptional regulator n=1 Tax=Litoribacterium kuwaitense TaxID=1398745 RepID=UPI0013EBF441|nr:TetR/AcrR family transcriptional regulator [Litoribacterium kuwaitense]NGP46399.1 TetR family transcriptional regulator [Litoribacterium kuwaitense]